MQNMQPNKYSRFKQVGNIAEKNSPLGKLLQRANNMLTHQETVRSVLDVSCREHCWLANYRNGTLFLQTDSAAWGARLRMQQRTIIQQLNNTAIFAALHSVKVSVQPRYTTEATTRTAKAISHQNAEQLLEAAQNTEDSALKAALTHLAQTSRSKNNS